MAERKFQDLLWNGWQGTSQQDDTTKEEKNERKFQDLLWSGIKPAESLRESLKDEEEYTAFSTWQIKSWAKSIWNFFDNARHTITDEDEDKWILDYSQYKEYKNLLDNADKDVDKTLVYKQMANEWVIDFDKFTAYEKEHEWETKPFEKYNKAVEDIKWDFNNKISNALSPYMKDVKDSYQLNAMTKAIERMNNQFWMFVDSYADTYKSTRDEKLLEDFNNTLTEYSNDIIKFTSNWAWHLINESQWWMWAYYNTLNDEWMKDIANNIYSIQMKAENKMAQAAIKDNFWDSWEAFKSWNLISSAAELFLAAANSANWILDKAGNLVEETKQVWLGWYDVVEELNHLNVYSNDAWALEKAFWTMWSWTASIIDAAPTIAPVVADILFWSKTGLTWVVKWAKWAKLAKTTQWAEKIDDVLNALFKSKKSYKKVMQSWDLLAWAEEWSTLLARYMKNMMDDIILFDIWFQQFEWRPLSDDDAALNMLFNLPLDMVAAMMTKPMFFKSALSNESLMSDLISEDALKMFQKSINTKKTEEQVAESYYMIRSMETKYTPKKNFTLEQIKDLPNGEALVEYIKKVQETSQWTWERLNTFWSVTSKDILLEAETRKAMANGWKWDIVDIVDKSTQALQVSKGMVDKFQNEVKAKNVIMYIENLISNWLIDAQLLKSALNKSVSNNDWFKKLIYAIFTDDDKLYQDALRDIANAWLVPSQTELSNRLSRLLWNIITKKPEVVKDWDIINGYVKNGWLYQNIFNPTEVLDENIFKSRLEAKIRWWQLEVNKIDTEVITDAIDKKLATISWKEQVDISDIFADSWIWKFLKDQNIWEWTVTDDTGKKYLWKQDPKKVWFDSLISRAWFKINIDDNWISILWDSASLTKLKNSFNRLNSVRSVNWISQSDWNAYRLMFFDDYISMFKNNVESINAKLIKETGYSMTEKELEWFAKDWKHWTDRLYDTKKSTAKTPTQKEVKEQAKQEVKAWMDVEEVDSAFKSSLEWETNAVEVEQKAAKAVIKHTMFNPTIKDGKFDRDSLKSEIKNLFKQKTSKTVQAWEWTKWYATIREETMITTDEATLDKIADKIIDTVDVFKADSLDDRKAVYETVSNWFSVFAMTPQSAILLADSNLDFYWILLWRIILDDKKSAARYVKKMDSLLNTMKDQYKTFKDLSNIDEKKSQALYEYNGKIWNLKSGILQIEEWVEQIKQYIRNKDVQQLIPWVKEQVISQFNKVTDKLFSKSDFDRWYRLANKKPKAWLSKSINEWKVFTLKDLTNDEIDDICAFLASNELKRSNFMSEEFYNTLVKWYKKWFEVTKANSEWLAFKLNWMWEFKYNWWVELWTINSAFILWSIKNENLAASAILHEATHSDIANRWMTIGREELKEAQMNAVKKWEKEAELDYLNRVYFWWSMVWYVKSLQDKLKEAVLKLNEAKKQWKWADYVNSLLYNYSNQYTRREIRDSILNKYSKDNLVNMLVEKYNNLDVSSWDLFLSSFIDDEDVRLIDELITEYSSLAALWEAGYKFANAPYINEALWALEKAAEVIDRFRILAAQKIKSPLDTTGIKEALSATFDAVDMMPNRSISSRISDFISKAVRKRSDVTTEWDGIRYIRWIQNAMWTKGINPEVQSASEMRSSVLTNLNEFIAKWVKSDWKTKLSKEDINELKELRWYLNELDDEETIYFLDMIDWVHISPRKVMEDFSFKKAPDWSKEWEREVTHNKRVSKVSQDITNKETGEKTALSKAVSDVVSKMLAMWQWSKAVPVLATLSSMAWDVWVLNWRFLWAISRLIGNEDAMIDISKVIVWDEVHKAYEAYLEAMKEGEIAMDEWTFITNRLIATVLDTYGKYSPDSVKLLNDQLYESEVLQLINDLRYNAETNTQSPEWFKALYRLVSENMWDVNDGMFVYDANEILKKATPWDLEWFNKALIWYLYERLWTTPKYWDDYALNQVKQKFLWLINNYMWIEGKKLEEMMLPWYAPKSTSWEKLATKKVSIADKRKARQEAAKEYVNSIEQKDWRYELSKKSFLPYMLNFINDMVDSWIIVLEKWTDRLDYLWDVVWNLNKKLFKWFANDYYEMVNKLDWIDLSNAEFRKKWIDLYRKFCDKWSLKLSTQLTEFDPVIKLSKKKWESLSDRFWSKWYKDFDWIVNADEKYTSSDIVKGSWKDELWNDESYYHNNMMWAEESWLYDDSNKYTLKDFVDDEDIFDEFKYADVELNWDDSEINFWFRNADGELVQDKSETMKLVDSEVILNEAINLTVETRLLDKLLVPYQMEYNPKFIIKDSADSDLAKQLEVNLWVYYNSIKWVDWANRKIDNMLYPMKKQAENEDNNIIWRLWNKVKSFKDWNFTDGNPVHIANNFWVDQLLGRSINWWTVAKVNVRLGNWITLSYKMKDWKLVNNIKTMNPTKLMYGLLPALTDKWAIVKLVWRDWKQLFEDNITKTNIWRSFIWQDIVDRLWLWWVERNINKINADEYRELMWLWKKWLEWKLSWADMIEISKAIWADNVSISNDAALQIIYGKALSEEKSWKATKKTLTNLKKNLDKTEDKVKVDKDIAKIDNILNQISAIKDWIKKAWPKDEEWTPLISFDTPIKTFKDKIQEMVINDVAKYYDEEWKPWVEWVSKWDKYVKYYYKKQMAEWAKPELVETKLLKQKTFKSSKVITELANGKKVTTTPKREWKPIGFYQNYAILEPESSMNIFEEEGRKWLRWDYNPEFWYEWAEPKAYWISDTLFNFNESNTDILNTLTRDEQVSDEDFMRVVIDNDWTSLWVRLRNETTGEEIDAEIMQIDVVNQEYWTAYKEYVVMQPERWTKELPNDFVMHYNAEEWWVATDKRAISYYKVKDWQLELDANWQPIKDWYNYKATTLDDYNEVVEAAKKKRESELVDLGEDLRWWEMPAWLWERNLWRVKKAAEVTGEEAPVKQIVNEESLQKKTTTIAEDFANQFNTYDEIDNAGKASDSIFSLTNYFLLGNDPYLVQMRWARWALLSNHWDELRSIAEDWNRLFAGMDKTKEQAAIKDIKETLAIFRKNNRWVFRAAYPMWEWTPVKYKDIVNRLAKVFDSEWWKSIDIISMINNAQSIDEIIYKLRYSDALSVIWMTDNVHNITEARDVVETWAKQFVSEKRAKQIASDYVGDPLGTGKWFRAMANIRSAYRFAKYSILSPVSGTIMYINSKFLWDTLFAGKRKGLEWMLANETFNKIIDRPDVLAFLDRGNDIITNSSSDIMNKWLFVNEWLNKVADFLTKKWSNANDTLKTILNWWIHSLYDKQMSWEMRKLAFAQALKENHIYDWQLDDLLKSIEDWTIKSDPRKRALWNRINASSEEFFARFFTNTGTQALSRHKRSRLWWFNFLQWYVVNRTDEMLQGFRQWSKFVDDFWGFKNITWEDIVRHLNEDNQELKSFMNNVIASAKLWYYLDKAADSDWSEADNLRAYFIDANDYLSSLDTVWFMRLFKAPLEWVAAYKTYSEMSGKEATILWWVKVAAMESFAEVCSQFFREGKFLNAMLNPIIAGMRTWDLDFAATVAGTEWEKMANSLWRFGLVDWMEKYWLEDFSEDSDVIWQMLLNTDKSTVRWQEQNDLYNITSVDKIINDPSYSAVTAIWYLPLIWELIKYAADKWWYSFNEAKYREMMEMVDNDKGLKKLYNWELDTEVFSDDAINRIWTDFISFNYPYKTLKSPGIHSVWSFANWKDITLNSMKEDVFVQNICEKLWMTIEEFHNAIVSDSAKKTGKLKIAAAAEAAEPGSWKIVLSYMMANRLYELEKEVTKKDNPATADVPEDVMPMLKREVLEEYWDLMFTADKTSWYKAIREYISEVNPAVFKSLYNNNTLNSYVGSVWFMDMLMWDAAKKWDVNAKYIKNVFSVISKYMEDDNARVKMVEHIFWTIDNLNAPQTVKNMAMEWVLAGNIDFYNRLKNSPALSVLYKDVLDSFEHRVWWVMDNVDIQDDRMYRQWKKYTPYTSQYGNDNKKVDDDLKKKVKDYYNPLTWWWKPISSRPVYNRTGSYNPASEHFNWQLKYYENLIKTYSDRLVKSTGKKYPAEWTEKITFKTGSNNRWSVKWQSLSFPKHKSKEYRTKLFSNLPGSHW